MGETNSVSGPLRDLRGPKYHYFNHERRLAMRTASNRTQRRTVVGVHQGRPWDRRHFEVR